MPELHISKVAVGCDSLDALRARVEARREGARVAIATRFRPKRADELVGGSLFWIVKHRLIARQEIFGFEERESDGRTLIWLSADLVPIELRLKRAHQGWRYLDPREAPPDAGSVDGMTTLPSDVARELARLALI